MDAEGSNDLGGKAQNWKWIVGLLIVFILCTTFLALIGVRIIKEPDTVEGTKETCPPECGAPRAESPYTNEDYFTRATWRPEYPCGPQKQIVVEPNGYEVYDVMIYCDNKEVIEPELDYPLTEETLINVSWECVIERVDYISKSVE